MKDTTNERPAPGRIAFLSPLLHFLAMPALVYLRSSFGFVFLRSKAVFFAFSWAFVVFFIIAWNEPALWRDLWAVCLFGVGSVVLYWLHLATAVSREMYRSGAHDQYSGRSHLLRLGGFQVGKSEMAIHLWTEPAIVLVAAVTLRYLFTEQYLSTWLFFTAIAMVSKEIINYWGGLRRDKGRKDMVEETAEQSTGHSANSTASEKPLPTRKEPVTLPRNTALADQKAKERRFAELLRIRPPFTIEKAEENYRALIKLEHPDTTEQSSQSNARTAELNEAINFFRHSAEG